MSIESRQKTCSINGDHATAIKFYKEELRALGSETNCEVLSTIADEYKAIEDYASAEEYWKRCCAVAQRDSYKYIALKGDFLYRQYRREEAVETYEKTLKELKDTEDRDVNFSMVKSYARITHFIISSHVFIGNNNLKEKYHEELKHEIDRFLLSIWSKDNETDAYYLSKLAWEIYEEDQMTNEALILIDYAIELDSDANYYTKKAIFIEDNLKISLIAGTIEPHDLDLINKALKNTSERL